MFGPDDPPPYCLFRPIEPHLAPAPTIRIFRPDGLVRREVTEWELKDLYVDREDHLKSMKVGLLSSRYIRRKINR